MAAKAGSANHVEDITELFEYFDTARKPSQRPDVGQVVLAPVLSHDKKHQIAEAKRSDPHSHTRADIVIRSVDDKVDFRGKPGRLPIYAMSLAQTEELVVTRAKKRPCVILAKTTAVDVQALPASQRGKALSAFGESYLLAPIFSVTTAIETRAFGPVMTARVKCMLYPEFMYVPQSGLIIKEHGVMRLDRTCWSHLLGASEPQPLFVSSAILGFCWEQIRVLAGNAPSQDYKESRELMLSCLPAECQ